MPAWMFLGSVAAATSLLAWIEVHRRSAHKAAAKASGLIPIADLSHLPEALQRSALWALGDGGFERRVVHGTLARGGHADGTPYRSSAKPLPPIEITAFDLETLRQRRGEWAWLPVEPPFRIGGVVSAVVCEVAPRAFPHTLLKRAGRGDDMRVDDWLDPQTGIATAARIGLGLGRSYASELPTGLVAAPLPTALPTHWRAYGRDAEFLDRLLAAGFATTLEHATRRDLVIELLDSLVIVYPAALDVVGADAFAELVSTALDIVEGLV